ncbi:replication initiation protein, partial [Staphylococcus aureus]
MQPNQKVYIDNDKAKAGSWARRIMRIVFNPNKITRDERMWLKQNIISYMAFDFEDDLIDYYA